ncbi:MAG: hypothetical protein AAGA70_04020 [Pseudomonadota bacterium]
MAVGFEGSAFGAIPPHMVRDEDWVETHTDTSLRALDLADPHAPDIIISPVFSGCIDAFDLAVLLQEHGFAGRYLAITRPVTNPSVIHNDIAHHAPSLDFDIVVMGGAPRLRAV